MRTSTIRAVKLMAVALVAGVLSACSTTGIESVEKWQGKTWRAVVVKPMLDTTKNKPTAEWAKKAEYDDKTDGNYRLAAVQFSSGWDIVMAYVNVPDQIDFSQIPKGTLVDIATEKGPDVSFAKHRFTRITRIVCAKDDVLCMDAEKKAKRFRAVVDEHPPADAYLHDGLTFSRKITPEDIAKYK